MPNTNNKNNNRVTGDKGEEVACHYLEKHGFLIQERNYQKKWGEMDIIAVKDGILQFCEVKSVVLKGDTLDHRPEENVDSFKIYKLRRIIETFLNERKYGQGAPFAFHVITVIFDQKNNKIKVKMLDNIIL